MPSPRRTNYGWEAWVTATVDGKRHRRHVRGRTRAEVNAQVDRVRSEWHGGVLPDGGAVTLSDWLQSWITAKAMSVRPKTLTGYRGDMKHIDPLIGSLTLAKLTVEDIERLYRHVLDRGRAPATVIHIRATLTAALGDAVARGRIARNVASLAAAPRDTAGEVQPLNLAEVQMVLTAAGKTRNGVRWVMAIETGLRQGEMLGLQWSDLDQSAGVLSVRRALARRGWEHGCGQTKQCAASPAKCPQRLGGGLLAGPLKTAAGRRTLAISEPLVDLLIAHRRAQAAERLRAGEDWNDGGWIFSTQTGNPIDPRNDLRIWLRMLRAAKITRPVRIHDLRHTAATLQLAAGTDSRVLLGLFGWTSTSLVNRYAHVVEETKRAAASRMAGVLWPERGIG